MDDDLTKAVVAPLERQVRPTHWMDERGLVLTNKQREDWGGDWALAYNVPCRSYFGRVTPLYKCGHCGGRGHSPGVPHDPCPVCGRSGGLSGPNVRAKPATAAAALNVEDEQLLSAAVGARP